MDHAVALGAIERRPLPTPEPERRKYRKHFPAVTSLPEARRNPAVGVRG
jgi:hypothetical protein